MWVNVGHSVVAEKSQLVVAECEPTSSWTPCLFTNHSSHHLPDNKFFVFNYNMVTCCSFTFKVRRWSVCIICSSCASMWVCGSFVWSVCWWQTTSCTHFHQAPSCSFHSLYQGVNVALVTGYISLITNVYMHLCLHRVRPKSNYSLEAFTLYNEWLSMSEGMIHVGHQLYFHSFSDKRL